MELCGALRLLSKPLEPQGKQMVVKDAQVCVCNSRKFKWLPDEKFHISHHPETRLLRLCTWENLENQLPVSRWAVELGAKDTGLFRSTTLFLWFWVPEQVASTGGSQLSEVSYFTPGSQYLLIPSYLEVSNFLSKRWKKKSLAMLDH